MNPKQFLRLAGAVLVLVALLGWVGVLGPTSESSFFGSAWWFDAAENWAHLVLGVVALLAAYTLSHGLQKLLTRLVGVLAVLVGLYSLLISDMLWGANLENPLDTLLHLGIGIWALWAAGGKPKQ